MSNAAAAPIGRRACRGPERGSAILELPLLLGLVVIPFAFVVLTLPVWVERRAIGRDAAAEVARSIAVDGSTEGMGPLLAELEVAAGLAPGALRVSEPPTLVAGDTIRVSVEVDVPLVSIPVFGAVGGFAWTATHAERIPDHGALS